MSFLAKRARGGKGKGAKGGARAHHHVVNMVECFRDRTYIYLVMEFCGRGELFDVLCNSPQERFPERVARRYFRHIVSGVLHLHKHGIVHRDISLENVLLNEQDNAKLCDFGLCKPYSAKGEMKKERNMRMVSLTHLRACLYLSLPLFIC